MRVLAFDTATSLTVVALRDLDDAPNVCLRTAVDLTAVDVPPAGGRPGHARRLLALIEELLEQSGSGWEAIDRIAVGAGPGTFTGLRIGIATAQALAAATATPLVGISTLESLEQAALAPMTTSRPVLAVIDARRGEAFVAGDGLPPSVLTPRELGEAAAERSGQSSDRGRRRRVEVPRRARAGGCARAARRRAGAPGVGPRALPARRVADALRGRSCGAPVPAPPRCRDREGMSPAWA